MRVSRVSRSRISDIVVSRNTVVNSVDGVTKTPSVFPVHNNVTDNSSNFLLSKEAFYDNIEKMNKKHKNFVGKLAEDELHKRKNDLLDTSDDDILAFIQDTIEKFNLAMDCVKRLDEPKRKIGLDTIIKTVTAHNRPLSNMGILSDRNHHMRLNQEKFLSTISKSPHHLKLLLDPERGILRKIHDSFTEVLA